MALSAKSNFRLHLTIMITKHLTKAEFLMKNAKIGYLYLLLTFTIWGSLYVVSKFVLNKLPVFTVSFLRFFIAGIAMYLFMRRKKFPEIQKKDYRYIALIGFCGYFIAIGAQLLGTQLVGASVASLVNSLNPIVIIFVAAIVLKEKLTWQKISGVILSLVGVYLIIGGSTGGVLLGILVSLFSVVVWSIVSVFMRKITQKYDPVQITTYGILIAAACNLPIAITQTAVSGKLSLDFPAVLSLLYMGIVCTGFAHFLWNKSLSMLPAGNCSLFYPIQPVTSVMFGVIFLRESLTSKMIIGGLLIIIGIIFCLVCTGDRKKNTDMGVKAD